MVEERCSADGAAIRYYGGDTLNTAVHLARFGHRVSYASALGSDPESTALCRSWSEEQLDCSLILSHPSRKVGQYYVLVDEEGERSFSYDRSMSAAREMFTLPGQEDWQNDIAHAELFVFSLISLAILPDNGREQLLHLADRVRRSGGKVAFDGNYRPALWDTSDLAREWRDRAIALSDFGLPTLDDERALGAEDAGSVVNHWRSAGCGELVVKLGEKGCLSQTGDIVPPERIMRPIDTSGAGDAFDAAYLSARLAGIDAIAACSAGHRLAGWVIQRPGAVPALDDAAPYSD
ncbi:sugar kinase [Altererythrobacter endophyticus]|uniref:Sugar kinase n=2 Tax=Altericroceibacterium endophyticum TaxID=1808508 RepID=A0A6I4T2W5_9SPHN|nr:sugar kinase [Altericroceibacterium endophyticum]